MVDLVIASNNAGKIKEIRSMVDGVNLLSLNDIGFSQEIDEPYHTFWENAHQKAITIHEFSKKNVFADDSGICVPALGNMPGVISAHYAGEPRSDERNLQKLIADMQNEEDRTAFYKAVICLVWAGKSYYFEGTCYGSLLHAPRGTGGFGYDPIFVPEGYDETFAELPLDVKNSLSHRGEAVGKMVKFIQERMR